MTGLHFRSCLNLIQDSPARIQEENDLIASLSLLEEFGVKILPLQVRLCKDRLALVKDAVQSKPGAYKQKQKVREEWANVACDM